MPSHHCASCGGAESRVVAQSAAPPGAFVQCVSCGRSSFVAPLDPGGAPPKVVGVDVDTRRIERLVTTVIAARQLPVQLMFVGRTPAGWHVTVRAPAGDYVKFDVAPDTMPAMRTSIEDALRARP